MPTVQKVTQLSVTHKLTVKGTEFSPIEAPEYPSEKATAAELAEAFVDLIARLTDAGVFLVAEEADADAPKATPEAIDAPQAD